MVDDKPAKAAGIMVNDVIKEIDGKQITTWNDLSNAIVNSEGKELTITIERDSEIIIKKLNHFMTKSQRNIK